jgi:uncharacterized protein (TIGR03437 family)
MRAVCLFLAIAFIPAAWAQTQPAGGGNPQNSTGVYTAAYTLSGGTATQTGQTYAAGSDYEFGIYVANAGTLTLTNPVITTTGQIGNGVEASLNTSTTGATVTITNGSISTSGLGGNGIFAAAGGTFVTMNGGSINCTAQFGHGILTTYAGTVTLNNVTISTKGGNGAALANDAGGGTITATGVTATTAGSGSPGIYAIGSTTVITVTNSTLTSTGEVGAVTTGGGVIIANNSNITGTTAGVRTFNQGTATSYATISGGTLTATSGDAFYAQGASGAFVAKAGAVLKASSGNIVNSVTSGAAVFTADGETLTGNIVADSTSTTAATLQNGTALTGTVTNAALTIDSTSSWSVTANSTLTSFVDKSGISGSSITNVTGNGYTVYYNATLAANSYLGGLTYALVKGGVLTPVGSVSTGAPAILSGGVASAASGVAGVAPGGWIAIYGTNLATTTGQVATANLVNGSLPTTFGGASVTIDGKAAFIDYVSPTQLNVESPADSGAGTVTVTVITASGTATTTAVLQPVMPGIFTASNYVLAVRFSDSAIINGTGAASPGYSTSASARPGDVLSIFATGLGATTPAVAPGLVFSGYDANTTFPTVTIGGITAPVSASGLTGAGLYQINLTVPASLTAGTYPVIINQSGTSSPSTAVLKIATN